MIIYGNMKIALAKNWYGEPGHWVITSYGDSGLAHTGRTVLIAGNEGGEISPSPQDRSGESPSNYTTSDTK